MAFAVRAAATTPTQQPTGHRVGSSLTPPHSTIAQVMSEAIKVGLIVGAERTFPSALIEEIERTGEDVTAELVRIGAPRSNDTVPYAVIIDRMSHEVPFYRTYLKYAAMSGCRVINDPFIWSGDDKFLNAATADRLGIPSPRTLILPHKDYAPGLAHEASLRNLEYPLGWDAVIDYVGLPCILKDAHGGGGRDVHLCSSLDELLLRYNESGRLLMVAQEYIEWEQFVRCLCVGKEAVLPLGYDPTARRYLPLEEPLNPAVQDRIVRDSRRLMQEIGYEINCIDWAIRGDTAYPIDIMNPAPELEEAELGQDNFQWAVQEVAKLAIRHARDAR